MVISIFLIKLLYGLNELIFVQGVEQNWTYNKNYISLLSPLLGCNLSPFLTCFEYLFICLLILAPLGLSCGTWDLGCSMQDL